MLLPEILGAGYLVKGRIGFHCCSWHATLRLVSGDVGRLEGMVLNLSDEIDVIERMLVVRDLPSTG